jgi:hypothetical protein
MTVEQAFAAHLKKHNMNHLSPELKELLLRTFLAGILHNQLYGAK